jgi:hypothetical protein
VPMANQSCNQEGVIGNGTGSVPSIAFTDNRN